MLTSLQNFSLHLIPSVLNVISSRRSNRGSNRLLNRHHRRKVVSIPSFILGVILLVGTSWFIWSYNYVRTKLAVKPNRLGVSNNIANQHGNNANNGNETFSSSAVNVLSQSLKEPWTEHRLTTSADTPLIRSPHTIVTAYFRLRSKYTSDKYDEWMRNFLSLRDPMIIFTQADMVEQISQFRREVGPSNATVVVVCDVTDLPIAQWKESQAVPGSQPNPGQASLSFWEYQLEIDPEKRRHQSYELFWIWLSKVWFVNQAIDRNYFQSEFFMWSDIGCFRKSGYNGKQIIESLESISSVVPDRQTLLWMAHHRPNPPPVYLWTDKLKDKKYFYHSGSQGAGYREAWKAFLPEFGKTLDDFSSLFVGEDQCILQATCLRRPDLCAYIPFDQVNDNFYFGLRRALHNPTGAKTKDGKFHLWRPPAPIESFYARKENAK